MKILVLGIGNVLMGDEGIGVHIVRHLEKGPLPAGVDTLDGGTGGFHLMGHLQAYDLVILIDAALDGKPAGTVTQLRPKYSSDYPATLTAHDIGLKDLLDALYLTESRPDIVLFTVSIANPDRMSVSLSPEAEAAVHRAADTVLAFLYEASEL